MIKDFLRFLVAAFKGTGIELFPLRHSLRGYSWAKMKADVRAALNVSLLDFPQGMAYAMIAGLPVQVGIYCSALASMCGPVFASSRFIMLGPTNATAVILLSAILGLNLPPEVSPMVVVPLILILVSVFMVIGAFLRVASLIQYISRSVVTGYITAAALLIIVNQLKHILNLDIPRAASFIEVTLLTAKNLASSHLPSLGVALLTIAIYVLIKRTLKMLPSVACTLVLISALMPLLQYAGLEGIVMIDAIPEGSWAFAVPSIDFELISQVANAAFAIAFLSILESTSIAKTLAARSGDRININQQMISLGAANLVNAFGSGMVVSGSLTRSTLNFNSGARTPLASVFSGLLLIGGIFLLGRFLGYVPRCALAALVVSVGVSLINREQIRIMMRSTRSDAIAFLTTFLGGLVLSLDTAIYMGAAASIILFLRKVSKPELQEIAFNEHGELSPLAPQKQDKPEISIVHVEGDLFFGSADLFLDQTRLLVQGDKLKIIILRLRNAYHVDATSALAIGDLVKFAQTQGSFVIVSSANPSVEAVFRNSGIMDIVGEENFFRQNPENPNISTRDALKRAQQILGDKKADITLYAKENKE